ncbi:uroporphyrinogen-III C-methyltransferase [Sphingobacterium gobiense]|uniref:uroporphyrinogen-III C-methyltransferase n=1 Tax=Sphingobacterium gobiense TaxID=1382456 RepID=A0A2S9JLJ0_9SPHI|nr:uroporphyrinogen-III C-methyltransferase [Sphingobacterium gobiense]PRD53986.1 uroporphyrinogen-III C-methyltransferase [Sphingobacterium gobiense]
MINRLKYLKIVGSGPGDPELLTIKAYKSIKNAEVILYDNLINEEILHIASEKCLKIYVGKHPYGKYMPQGDINTLIAYYCERFSSVVRLKGGDPYVFGRGFEEWLVAKTLGVDVEYIPGISSMQGAGLNDIPLTHRGISEGVWALTGMKTDGDMAADLSLAVHCNSTVVIYMGMRKLAEIARIYLMNGKGDKPAAIIQQVSRADEKKVICKVKDLVKVSQAARMSHPAIIVIGEVVTLQHDLLSLLQPERNIV